MAEFSGKVLLLGNYLPDQQESMQRFAQMFLTELPRHGINVELIRPEQRFGKLLPGSRGLAKWIGYLDKFAVFPRALKKKLRSGALLHICDHSNAIYTKYAASVPHVVTCHDMLAVRAALGEIPENPTRATGRVYQRMILRGLNRAQRVVCVSKATRNDVVRLSQTKHASVVYNGLNFSYRPMERAEAIARVGEMGRFILHVGGNQWYKNRLGAARIHERLLQLDANAPNLVMVGKEFPATERVRVLTKCDNEDLRAFYSLAEALLFPSLAEGFGWPLIEAQACGCWVVTSNRAPMTEIAGDAAVYIDPVDVDSAAKKLHELLIENAEQKEARRRAGFVNAARFSTDQMISGYLEEYAKAAAAL